MRKHLISFCTVVILGIVILGAPSENQFLNRLNSDYGSIHGVPISSEVLKDIGNSNYRSYLLWSEYHYAFGSIEVNYVGVAFMTFYLGSNTRQATSKEDKIAFNL